MGQNIDPRQVLLYLNEMGFTNINAQQLKEFIIDLKKLIKHDLRHSNLAKTSFSFDQPQSTFVEEESDYCRCSDSDEYILQHNTNESTKSLKSSFKCHKDKAINVSRLHSECTIASHLKEVPRKEKLISVHIQHKPKECIPHEHCIHIGTQDKAPTNHFINVEKLNLPSSSKELSTESTVKSGRPDSQPRITCSSTCRTAKPKTAFIKQKEPKLPFNKCDPVALYHYYQSQWKRTKIPGQDSRDDLRWAIRERMLGGPKVEVLRKRYSFNSIGSSWR